MTSKIFSNNRKLFLFITVCIFASNVFSAEIEDQLKKLENFPQYISNNIKASYDLLDDGKIFKISLNKGRAGQIKIHLNGDATKHFLGIRKQQSASYFLKIPENYFAEFDKIMAITNKNNLATFDYISTEEPFRGKNLSYPLMCIAFYIIKDAFNKDYLVLDDAAGIAGYYESMGFTPVFQNKPRSPKESSAKFGKIDEILSSKKCEMLRM